MSMLSFAKKIAGRQEKKAAAKTDASKKATAPVKSSLPAVEPTAVHTGVLGLTPLITEESVTMHGDRQTIAFRVRLNAHKGEIVAAVKQRFGVEPVSVRTLHVRGKIRRRGVSLGRSNAWKKAYVTLPAGKTIDISA